MDPEMRMEDPSVGGRQPRILVRCCCLGRNREWPGSRRHWLQSDFGWGARSGLAENLGASCFHDGLQWSFL